MAVPSKTEYRILRLGIIVAGYSWTAFIFLLIASLYVGSGSSMSCSVYDGGLVGE